MPALSKKQQKFMGIVRSIQKGEQPASKFNKDAQDVAKDMKKKDVKDFASTKHKGLPMKKEILGKLKEMIKQELSEYTYGVGDVVKDDNPTCPHYGAEGKVKSVNPRSVVFVVTNKGDNFKPGQELEKSHDQMKKIGESVNEAVDWKQAEKLLGKWASGNLRSFNPLFTPVIQGLEAAIKDKNEEDYQYTLKALVKGVKAIGKRTGVRVESTIQEQTVTPINKIKDIKNLVKKDLVSYRGTGAGGNFEISIRNKKVPGYPPSFALLQKDEKKYRDIRSKQFKIKPVAKYFIKGNDLNQLKKFGNVGFLATNRRESINEMSAKSKKIISKLGKKEKEVFSTMVDMLGFDQVMADYKRDKKAFKQALKDMSENINEGLSKVPSGKEFNNGVLTAIELIVRQANNLKGPLSKHPMKRNVRKIKAVENIFKKFIKPEIDKQSGSFEGVNLTSLKKYLADGKFKAAIEYDLLPAIKPNSFRGNSFYFLDDKVLKLLKKLSDQVKAMVNQLDKAQLENINEDGHTDVASSKRKVMIMVDDSNKLLNKLNGMNKEDSLPSWWTDKITLSQNYLQKATDYITNPVESVNEQWVPGNFDKALGKLKFNQFTPTNVKKISKRFKVDYKDAVEWIKLNHVINVADKPTMAESMNPSAVKKMRDEFEKTGQLPPHLKKFALDLKILKKKHKVKNIVVPGLEWMSDMKEQSVNEKKKMFPPKKMTPKQAKEYKKFIGYAKMGVEYQIDMSLFESINEARLDPKQLLQQLGGNRFIMMTGAKNLAIDKPKNELHMKIGRNAKGVSHVRIRLSSMDLYDMEFLQVRAGKIKIKSKEKGVYADQLGKMFKKNTGMNVRL